MVITYSIDFIDRINKPRIVPEDVRYKNLTEFINKSWGSAPPVAKSTQITRTSFGKLEIKERKSIFKLAETFDEETKLRLNELTCKISENNSEEILNQFKKIEFSKIEDKYNIMKMFHFNLITCIRYINLFVNKIGYITNTFPEYIQELRKTFFDFDLKKRVMFRNIDEKDYEEKFIIKNQILDNYKIIIVLLNNKLLFKREDLDSLFKETLNKIDEDNIELAIRLLFLMKQNKIDFDKQTIISLQNIVINNNMPKRLEFLLMDLE